MEAVNLAGSLETVEIIGMAETTETIATTGTTIESVTTTVKGITVTTETPVITVITDNGDQQPETTEITEIGNAVETIGRTVTAGITVPETEKGQGKKVENSPSVMVLDEPVSLPTLDKISRCKKTHQPERNSRMILILKPPTRNWTFRKSARNSLPRPLKLQMKQTQRQRLPLHHLDQNMTRKVVSLTRSAVKPLIERPLVARDKRWTERCANSRKIWIRRPLVLLRLVLGMVMVQGGAVSVVDVASVAAAVAAASDHFVVDFFLKSM